MKKNIIILFLLIGLIFCLNGCNSSSNSPNNTSTSYKTKYTITNYQYKNSSDTWVYVLVDKNPTQEELNAIAKELHHNFPATCFYLYSTLETIKAMYNYDSTDSYRTNKFAFPESQVYRDDMGIINKMAGVWTYTNLKYDSIKLE